jgi:light-regulated signal transduction histidine kinase (bacteriophytochrome)
VRPAAFIVPWGAAGTRSAAARRAQEVPPADPPPHLVSVRSEQDTSRVDASRPAAARAQAAASEPARDGPAGAQESERLLEELRRSNEELEQFAYAASHDLSEPLRVIAGFVQLLQQRYAGQLDDEADRFIAYTVAGVERMQAVIDDLLTYSRAGRVSLALAPVDTGALVGEVLQALIIAIAERATTVEVQALPVVWGEPGLLRQVFQNLIANAIKFTDGERPHVRVSAAREPGRWRFEVRDNGPGIEERHMERVFEMFQRLHGREVPGTGIGLAIAKRIVERHRGEISVARAPAGGSVFSFTIPDPPEDAL